MPLVERSSLSNNGSVIRVRGARVHNLKNIDVDIPRNKLVVITGPSGSGKSTLAFDTLYAEGQRQYIESLSVYARQYFQQLPRPDVDLIDGLQPTICIDQRPGNRNPRSTVATVTEIHDYLRLLMARVGDAKCFQCGGDIRKQTPEQIQRRVAQLPEGTKAMIMAGIVHGRKGSHKDVLGRIRQAGYVRVRIDGEVYEIEQVPELSARRTHDIDAVIDRVIIRPGIASRIGDSIQLAVEFGEGVVKICYRKRSPASSETAEIWRDELFSTHHACPRCEISYEELEPRTFSFNSPYGACPVCEGLGVRTEFDPELVIPDRHLSLKEGAIAPWNKVATSAAKQNVGLVRQFLQLHRFDEDTPIARLPDGRFQQLLYGDDRKFPGIILLLEKELATSISQRRLAQLQLFQSELRCQACQASRLRPEAMSVFAGGKAIHQILALSVRDARCFFDQLDLEHATEVATPLVNEIGQRLRFLERVGLGYLELDRSAESLSGGEFQRVRLATGIGSGLVGVCYILDEPSIGLHPRDNQRLIDSLRDLQAQGNTVMVVEHDAAIMRQADVLIDMGPSAGTDGGNIVAQGSPSHVRRDPASITGQYLSNQQSIETPIKRRKTAKTRSISLENVATNNLIDVSARFPLRAFVCVTGVSGSGKSSLVNHTLVPALIRRLGGTSAKPGPHTSLRGANQIDRVLPIDQAPIGRTPRSNPATYSGVLDDIRKVFAGTRQSKQRGYRVGRFSFNNKEGRCESCQGYGLRKIEMSFLPDLYVSCDRCRGARFNEQTLQVRYRDQSIADVLEMSVDEACGFFENFSSITRVLDSMRKVGLGYLPLGQPSTTLSGGEAQRVKLATELARVDTGRTLYVLDEPTTGLHFEDIRRLLDVLQQLVEKGSSVIVVEHNLDVIKCADWVIDLGPEGGQQGGLIVATGTPEDIARLDDNHTGHYLKSVL